jgi:hypothetical protein
VDSSGREHLSQPIADFGWKELAGIFITDNLLPQAGQQSNSLITATPQ